MAAELVERIVVKTYFGEIINFCVSKVELDPTDVFLIIDVT